MRASMDVIDRAATEPANGSFIWQWVVELHRRIRALNLLNTGNEMYDYIQKSRS